MLTALEMCLLVYASGGMPFVQLLFSTGFYGACWLTEHVVLMMRRDPAGRSDAEGDQVPDGTQG